MFPSGWSVLENQHLTNSVLECRENFDLGPPVSTLRSLDSFPELLCGCCHVVTIVYEVDYRLFLFGSMNFGGFLCQKNLEKLG